MSRWLSEVIGNVWGALAGGLILGIIENLAAYYVSIGWIDAISYGVFILVLIFLPKACSAGVEW